MAHGSWLRRKTTLVAFLITASLLFFDPQVSFAASLGSVTTPSLYPSDQIWNTWNATTSPAYISAAGISLFGRTVYLESRNTISSGQCVDSMWDWQVSGGISTHHDARILRNCRKGKLFNWNQIEGSAPSGDNFSFVGESRSGLCYLFGPYAGSGAGGTNAPPDQPRTGTYSCKADLPFVAAPLFNMQANVAIHDFCIGMVIYYGSNTPVPYNTSNPRKCNA
jgi:hypothetical protein